MSDDPICKCGHHRSLHSIQDAVCEVNGCEGCYEHEAVVEPLSKDCHYVVEGVITDSVTEEKGYVLSPIAEYPTRQIKVGDIFQPIGYDPKRAH